MSEWTAGGSGEAGPRTPDELRRTWDDLAGNDPLWAVVTLPEKRGGGWTVPELLETGRREIEAVMAYADSLGLPRRRRRALDFGCGVGRLTQALAPRFFEHADGVDISPRMLELARRLNDDETARRFYLNPDPDLELFEAGRFDLVYSAYVLQHIPPELTRGYVAEMVRVLAPGGLLLFHLPSEPVEGADRPLPDEALRAELRIDDPPTTASPGERLELTVHVRNAGTATWPAVGTRGRFHVTVGNHWLSSDGEPVLWDDGRGYLPHDVGPGEEVGVHLVATAPEGGGNYVLEVDLVQEGVRWFSHAGEPTHRTPVRVRRRARDLLFRRSRPRSPADHDEIEMGMHGVSVDVVHGWIAGSGGELVEVGRPLAFGSDFLARDWVDRCYAVTKGPR